MRQAIMHGFDEEGMYDCQFHWEEDCSIQCGSSGVVFSEKGNYETAFFEAFPKEPRDFIRGEGKTIEEAEHAAWEKYQLMKNCPNHEFEKRGHKSGVGFCKHCNYQNNEAFEPENRCDICGTPTNWTKSNIGKYYCREHKERIPEEEKKPWQKKDHGMNSMQLFFSMLASGKEKGE